MLRRHKKRKLFVIMACLCMVGSWSLGLFDVDTIPQLFVSTNWTPLLPPFNINRTFRESIDKSAEIFIKSNNTWIIITSSGQPTVEMITLCSNRHLNVLILGNKQFKDYWRNSSCTLDNLLEQRDINFKSMKYLKSNENLEARKNCAFLLAISMGAKTIYDIHEDDISFITNVNIERKWCLGYKGSVIFNPFGHFGNIYDNKQESIPYDIIEVGSPLLEALMPITDYVFSRRKEGDSFQLAKGQFDQQAPPISASSSVFFSFIPKTKVYHRDSMWSAVSFQHLSIKDELISQYWQQRLLWELEKYYLVHPSRSEVFFVNHIIDDVGQHAIVEMLKNWKCSHTVIVSNCILQLTQTMIDSKLWDSSRSDIVYSWISDLSDLEYKFPSRRDTMQTQWSSMYSENLDTNLRVLYAPKLQVPESTIHSDKNYLLEMCKNASFPNSNFNSEQKVVEDILLLIVFNLPIYKYINIIQAMYGSKYKTIAYCGDDMSLFTQETKHLKYRTTFIEEKVKRGYYIYKCISTAMKIGYNVSGVFMVSDDVLLNTWNVDKLPLHKAWTHQLYTLQRGHRHNWYNWRQSWGETAFSNAWKEITSKSSHNSSQITTDFTKFDNRLQILSNVSSGLCFGYVDIVYLPRYMFTDFIYYGDIFSKHELFLEMAIAILVGGLADKNDIVVLKGTYLWYSDRPKYRRFFSTKNIFFHPFKIGIELQKISGMDFFCRKYVPLI